MALTVRTLTNLGAPICRADGEIVSAGSVIFSLVYTHNKLPASLFDATTGEVVVNEDTAVQTDANGIFTVNLWPNSRGEIATCYKVTITGETTKPFYILVADGVGSQLLIEARTAFGTVTPQIVSLFDALLQQITAAAELALTDAETLENHPASYFAPIASPALTGVPTAPTAALGTNTTQLSTTAFVQAALAALVDSSPAALNTLNELAAALGDDENFATTMTNALALKAPLSSPTFTGTPAAPTAAAGTNTTQVATTAFVAAVKALLAPLASPAFTGGISVTGAITATDLITPSAGILLNGASSYKIFGNATSGSTSSYIESYEPTNGSMTLNTSYTTSKIILKTQDTTRAEISSTGLTVTGDTYVSGDVSAATFTDRTPFYEGDAVAELRAVTGVNGEIDHATLPVFAQKDRVIDILEERKRIDKGKEIVEQIKIGERVEPGRDLGAMISILTTAIQQLDARLAALEGKK